MINTQERTPTVQEKTTSMPSWFASEFPDQVQKMQADLDQCREQVRKASMRIEYIQNIFRFCAQSLDSLDFNDPKVIPGLTPVLDVLGWKMSTAAPDQSVQSAPSVLILKDENDKVTFAHASIGAAPNRTQLGALIVAQTELWQGTGTEAKALVFYDEQLGPIPSELCSFAAKRSIGLISKSTLVRNAAEVVLAEADPDELRESILAGIGV
jgi:hypothetical protein